MNHRSTASAFAGLALAFVGTATVALAADKQAMKTDAARQGTRYMYRVHDGYTTT